MTEKNLNIEAIFLNVSRLWLLIAEKQLSIDYDDDVWLFIVVKTLKATSLGRRSVTAWQKT